MVKRITITGFSVLFAINAFAGNEVFDPNLPIEWASIITVSGGPAWASPGKDQYLYPYPAPSYQYYSARGDTTTLGTGELYFGLQHLVTSTLIGQFGIGVAGASDAQFSGVINVDGTPDVYSYQYHVSHVRAEFKGKLIAAGWRVVQPYVSGSFGVGFNHAHDYIPTQINPNFYIPQWYATNSVVAFSYTLGLGVQKMLTPNWQVGMGYEFADWGKNYLGGNGNLVSKGPGSAHLYTNELLFSLSYLF